MNEFRDAGSSNASSSGHTGGANGQPWPAQRYAVRTAVSARYGTSDSKTIDPNQSTEAGDAGVSFRVRWTILK